MKKAQNTKSEVLPYQNPALLAAKRVQDLLSRMTLEEKAAQMVSVWRERAEKLVDSGIGYDRTRRGSGAVDEHHSPLRESWADPATCPDELLLWFHRLPWDHRMRSGRTLWEEMAADYNGGAEEARGFEALWKTLQGRVDEERYQAALSKLHQQAEDAAAWRDKCVHYFRSCHQPVASGPRASIPAATTASVQRSQK